MEATATAPSLKQIIAKTIPSLLRVHHLNRDVVIGWIGERGGGKSIGAAATAAFDWGVEGDILRSNMRIAWEIKVDEDLAAMYRIETGSVHYESEELNKHKFLTFSPDYFRSVFVIDEINLWLADARRSMAQQNLLADDVTQQLRKWESPLFYTCIHEMFVDSRIRDMTDLFIKTSDGALTEDGLRRKQRQGLSFDWLLYPMTKKFTGQTYADNKQAIGPITINGKMLWDIIDTWQHQERKKYKPEEVEGVLPIHISEDPMVLEQRSKWGWLYEKILALHKQGVPELEDEVLWEYLGLKKAGISPAVVAKQLKQMGIIRIAGRAGHFNYPIDNFDLNGFEDKTEYALATAKQ